jgi:hypothetical protein
MLFNNWLVVSCPLRLLLIVSSWLLVVGYYLLLITHYSLTSYSLFPIPYSLLNEINLLTTL